MTSCALNRLARLEATSVADLHALASPLENAALGLRRMALAQGFASACAEDRGIMLNRTLGLCAADAERVPDILTFYRAQSIRRAFISVPEEAWRALQSQLRAAGCGPGRTWRRFQRTLSLPPPDYRGALSVRRIGPALGPEFARIAGAAFDLGPDLFPLLARLPGRPHAHVFMSFDGATAVGCGVLYVDGDAGYLTWGATAPSFRGRGSQRALMAARIAHARALGLAVLHTETGEAEPGQPQHSWNNILRAGFEPGAAVFNAVVMVSS